MDHIETAVGETGYVISTDPARVDLDVVAGYLGGESYWAKGRPAGVVESSIEHSTPFGAYAADGHQAGFARLVSDRSTFGWVCDVFVLDEHRGHGLGKALIDAVTAFADGLGIGLLTLATDDAHGLYRRFDFAESSDPQKWMYRRHPDRV